MPQTLWPSVRAARTAALRSCGVMRDGSAAHNVDDVFRLAGIVGEGGDGKADAAARQELETAQLVPAAADSDGLVNG